MKRILIPVLAAAVVTTACSEWTEVENKDFLPQIRQDDPVALEAVREFKAGEHLVTMMIVKGSATAPNRQNMHLTAMPDSVDFFLMTDVDNLHPTIVAEMAEVRQKKATRTLNVVDYTTIRNAWDALKEAAADTEQEADYTDDKFVDWCRTQTEKQLANCDEYGFDGIVASYLGTANVTAATPFIEAVDKWHQLNPDKLLFVRGYPAYINRVADQTIVADCDYIIILTDKASASVAISRQVRDQLTTGVPSDRIVLEASVPSIADGGDDAQVGATLRVAAEWVIDPKTSSTVKCDKVGLAASNAQDDYFNTPTYKRLREAIAILNPEPENDSENENDDEK